MKALTAKTARALLASMALAVVACSSPDTQQAGTVATAEPAPEIWEYPASDYPTMCIVFLPGGKLQFRGGFLFFNPGRWERNPRDGTVRIGLGGTSPFPFPQTRQSHEQRPGMPVNMVPEQRELVYRLGADTTSLEFAGFIFYRKTACSIG